MAFQPMGKTEEEKRVRKKIIMTYKPLMMTRILLLFKC